MPIGMPNQPKFKDAEEREISRGGKATAILHRLLWLGIAACVLLPSRGLARRAPARSKS